MRFGALVGHQIRRYRLVLAVLAAGLALFLYIASMIATSPEMTRAGGLAAIMSFVPPAMLKVLGIDPATLTTAGLLSLSYMHPFVLLAAGAWVARVPAASLAGEIGSGTMDLIASRPVSRSQVVLSVAAMLYGGLAVVMGSVWAGMAVALATRPELGIAAAAFVPLAAALFLLFYAFGGISLACSALSRNGGQAIGWAGGIMAVMFALDFISRSRESLEFLKWATLFTWVKPQEIAAGNLSPAAVGVLLGVGTAAAGVSLLVFSRRDL